MVAYGLSTQLNVRIIYVLVSAMQKSVLCSIVMQNSKNKVIET